MNMRIVRTVLFVCIIAAVSLLIAGGGCDDGSQAQDQKQKEQVQNNTVCQQCAAYDCAGCRAAPLCVAQCGCSQCGNDTNST